MRNFGETFARSGLFFNLFDDNGNGVDFDPDGDAFSLVAINRRIGPLQNTYTFDTTAFPGFDRVSTTLRIWDDGLVRSSIGSNDFNALAEGDQVSLSYDYMIADPLGAASSATATLVFKGENDAPTAVREAATISKNGFASFNLLANESDVDPDDSVSIERSESPTFPFWTS